MDARLTQRELIFFLPAATMREAAEREALRHAVITARAQALRDGFLRLASMGSALLHALATLPARRRARAELMALSPRQLADIGITRDDIPKLLTAGARRG